VDWSGADQTRHVVTEHTWTDLASGETVEVEGDHVWGLLDSGAGLLGGLTLDGSRDWHEGPDTWHVDLVDLEVRLQDPVPQQGTVALTNPRGKPLDLVFERVDENTIRATIDGARRTWVFDINALGIPSEVEDAPDA